MLDGEQGDDNGIGDALGIHSDDEDGGDRELNGDEMDSNCSEDEILWSSSNCGYGDRGRREAQMLLARVPGPRRQCHCRQANGRWRNTELISTPISGSAP